MPGGKEERRPFLVGLAGCQRRIGTTTQALQICHYLLRRGERACYIESNDTNYLAGIVALYKNIRRKEKNGALYWEGLLLYSGAACDKWKEEGFKFIVTDFGSMSEKAFDKSAFIKQDVKIIACGAKANEIFLLEERLLEYREEKIQYLFSFVPERDRKMIRYMMGEKGRDSHFSGFCWDPTEYSSGTDGYYRAILNG